MGHQPIPPRRQPDRESLHLGRARDAYVRGDIEIERFEELAEHVLGGGYLGRNLEPRTTPEPGTAEHAARALQVMMGVATPDEIRVVR